MRTESVCTVFLLAAALIVSLMVSIAGADPATHPVAPATQPSCDVFLVPFGSIDGDNSLDWAGKAVQQNLMTDLARAKFQVASTDKSIAIASDARAAAKTAGAKYIVTGTYQMADAMVRFNAQLIDTATGNVVGGLSATGAPRDLFNLEDALSAQAIDQLSHAESIAQANIQTGSDNRPLGPVPAALKPSAVVQIIQPVAVAQTGSTSSYDGSALQEYVDANRTPSTDYSQQVQNAQDRSTYDYGYNNFYPAYFGGYTYGLGYGGFGYGLIYSAPSLGYHSGFGWSHGR